MDALYKLDGIFILFFRILFGYNIKIRIIAVCPHGKSGFCNFRIFYFEYPCFNIIRIEIGKDACVLFKSDAPQRKQRVYGMEMA